MLVARHNQQEWLALMKEQLYDEEVEELQGTSIVIEFFSLYLANRLQALKYKLTEMLVAKSLPDRATGITIKMATANFPPHGLEWHPSCQGAYAKFTTGQLMLCMQKPQNL